GPDRNCHLAARRPACCRCLDERRTPVLVSRRWLLAWRSRSAPYQPHTASRARVRSDRRLPLNRASQPLPMMRAHIPQLRLGHFLDFVPGREAGPVTTLCALWADTARTADSTEAVIALESKSDFLVWLG